MLPDTQLRAIKPAERARKFSDSGGLYLHVAPNGGRYWRGDMQQKLCRGISDHG